MNSRMLQRGPWLVGALAVVFVAGCATAPRLHVDTADVPVTCDTFGWLEEDRAATIAEQRLRNEVTQALRDRGYRKVDASPDCLVTAGIFSGVRPRSPVSVGLGAGRWGGSVGGSVGVSVPVGGGARTIGNLAIDVIDVGRNAEVWSGTLEGAFRTPEPSADDVSAAVRQLLEEFPRRGE